MVFVTWGMAHNYLSTRVMIMFVFIIIVPVEASGFALACTVCLKASQFVSYPVGSPTTV